MGLRQLADLIQKFYIQQEIEKRTGFMQQDLNALNTQVRRNPALDTVVPWEEHQRLQGQKAADELEKRARAPLPVVQEGRHRKQGPIDIYRYLMHPNAELNRPRFNDYLTKELKKDI